MSPAVAASTTKTTTNSRHAERTSAARNLDHWNQASTAYAGADRLFAPEARFLSTYRTQLLRSALLDLGIGAGRTTRHFAPVCGTYSGIDYAQAMVEQARRNCPEYADTLEEADARNLSRYNDQSFDFVLFSFNGIDCIAPEDRMQVLSEVRRVLRPGGIFSFSSHNLDSVPLPGSWPMAPLNWANPWQTAYRLLQRTRRNFRIRPLVRHWDAGVVRERGWACFADGGESYEVPLYYVTVQQQRVELDQSGLRLFSVQDRDCRELLSEPGGPASSDSWLYYLAERAE
jgi:ubiquinone/menaquinone biosynthesis C-methylase UbiE